MSDITPHKFEHQVREKLHLTHHFEHKDIERASTIFNDTLTALKTPKALRASHYDDAVREMKKHEEWKRLPEHQRTALTDTLKQHLKIED